MKLRHVALTFADRPDVVRDAMAATLLHLGWRGRWIDPWTSIAHQGDEGGNVIVGPLAAFFEIRWGIVEGAPGSCVLHLEQTRNAWTGKGGILDGKRAGKRFDEVLDALRQQWPDLTIDDVAASGRR